MTYIVLGREYATYEAIADVLGVSTSTVHRWDVDKKLDEKARQIQNGIYKRRPSRIGKPIALDVPVVINGTYRFKSINAAARHYKVAEHTLVVVIDAGIFEIVVVDGSA